MMQKRMMKKMNNNIIVGKNGFMCFEFCEKFSAGTGECWILSPDQNFDNENNVIYKELFNMEYEKLIDNRSDLYDVLNDLINNYNTDDCTEDVYSDLEHLQGLEAQEHLDKINNFTKHDFKNMKLILEDILDIIDQLEKKKEVKDV